MHCIMMGVVSILQQEHIRSKVFVENDTVQVYRCEVRRNGSRINSRQVVSGKDRKTLPQTSLIWRIKIGKHAWAMIGLENDDRRRIGMFQNFRHHWFQLSIHKLHLRNIVQTILFACAWKVASICKPETIPCVKRVPELIEHEEWMRRNDVREDEFRPGDVRDLLQRLKIIPNDSPMCFHVWN